MKMVFPISFSIPECKVLNNPPEKEKELAQIIPGKLETYTFTSEEAYYDNYRKSWFAHTSKKAGWDCLRHYEILANGCIPIFSGIENCPPNTLTHYPLNLLKNPAKGEGFIRSILEYTRKHLTTRAMASYILAASENAEAKRILFLSNCTAPDYLRCLMLHGFKEIFGKYCHDYPCIPHLYTDYSAPASLYGRGMTYTCLLNKETSRDPEYDETIREDIINKLYDIVIFGSAHRGLRFLDEVLAAYNPGQVIFLCGEDLHGVCPFAQLGAQGFPVFIREL